MADRELSTPETQTTSGVPHYRIGPSYRIFRGSSITLQMPDEMLKVLNELINQTNHEPDEIFFKSLFLYKAAVDAEQEGKKMVILDSDGDIDQEIQGL